jgi:antitoxin VapB
MPDDGRARSTRNRAKLFTHGGSQAVRLPKEFRFDGTEVEIWRDGDTVHLRPARRDTARMWREIDARRGNEIMPYPTQAVLEEHVFFDDDDP